MVRKTIGPLQFSDACNIDINYFKELKWNNKDTSQVVIHEHAIKWNFLQYRAGRKGI